jgi:pimeloyl-ACP methyl ester carboxylesterase
MEASVAAWSQNSTTGRLNPIPIPSWLRASFKLTATVAPGLAAAWAGRVFFTPRHARVRPKEAEALAAAETFTLRVDGRRIRGWAWRGEGSPILLVHGWGGHTGQMTALASALVAAGRRVVGVDMPGHGESEGSRSSLIHFTRAIESAGALFGPFSGVVGHSFGCAAITLALSRSLVAERAVFVAPPAAFQDFWDRFCEALGVPDPVWERVIASSQERLRVNWSDTIPASLAPRMRVPLRVLHDHDDGEVGYQEGVQLVGLWPGAELVTTRGLGHNRILRDAGAVARTVEFVVQRN